MKVYASSHKQVERLYNRCSDIDGGLAVSLGSHTRVFHMPDTPENREGARAAGCRIAGETKPPVNLAHREQRAQKLSSDMLSQKWRLCFYSGLSDERQQACVYLCIYRKRLWADGEQVKSTLRHKYVTPQQLVDEWLAAHPGYDLRESRERGSGRVIAWLAVPVEKELSGKTCIGCASPIEYLADFPGPRCLKCHAAKVEHEPLERPDFIRAINGRGNK